MAPRGIGGEAPPGPHFFGRWKRTEFLASSVVEDELVGRVETDASHDVANLCAVDHAVSTVPEVEQIEHVTNVYSDKHPPTTTCRLSYRHADTHASHPSGAAERKKIVEGREG